MLFPCRYCNGLLSRPFQDTSCFWGKRGNILRSLNSIYKPTTTYFGITWVLYSEAMFCVLPWWQIRGSPSPWMVFYSPLWAGKTNLYPEHVCIAVKTNCSLFHAERTLMLSTWHKAVSLKKWYNYDVTIGISVYCRMNLNMILAQWILWWEFILNKLSAIAKVLYAQRYQSQNHIC